MDVYQRRRLVALSVLAGLFIIVVLLVRSCGGGDEAPITALDTGVSGATGAGGAPLSQQDYIDQADSSICLQANTQLASLDTSDAAQSATDEAQIVSGELQELQTLTLGPGEKGADDLDAYLNALEKQSSALLDLSVAAERGDDSATTELQSTADTATSDAADAAKRFGFQVCGDSSQVSGSAASGGAASSAGTQTPTTVVPATPTTTAPVVPTTPTTEAPTAPTEGGGAPAPAPAPTDGGDTGSASGGVTP